MATKEVAPIVNSPIVGAAVEPVLGDDNVVVPPSTLANQVAEDNPGHNPDYFPSAEVKKA